jgi:MraZ protein
MTERFRGSYSATIDDRGRIKIPARYLQALEKTPGQALYLTSINGDHILCYPLPVWEAIERQIENMPVRDPDLDEYVNRTSYWGHETELDPKGRILIPSELRQSAGLDGDVLVLGKIDYLTLWNKAQFVARSLGGDFDAEKMQKVARLLHEHTALSRHE